MEEGILEIAIPYKVVHEDRYTEEGVLEKRGNKGAGEKGFRVYCK